MNINQISQQNVYVPVTSSIPIREGSSDITVSDGFTRGLSVDNNSASTISFPASHPEKSQVSPSEEVAKIEEKPIENQFTGRVFRVRETGVEEMTPCSDGGFLVDEETGARAYMGDNAKSFLERTTVFKGETEVVIPDGTEIDLRVSKQGFSLAEAGAVLLSPGAETQIKVKGRNPLVLSIDKPPAWYQKIGPEGAMKEQFDQLAALNQSLAHCRTPKNLFNKEDLQKLFDYGVVSNDTDNENAVRWDPQIKNNDHLTDRLIEAGFSSEGVEKHSKIWYDTMKRKLMAIHCGRAKKDSFTDEQKKKLIDTSLAKEIGLDKENLYWTGFLKESEFRDKLASSGVSASDIEDIAKVWKKTTKSGYDNTGMVWDHGKITAYNMKDKLNMWSEGGTEWIVNSTEYAGENEPFTVGVSYVKAKKAFDEPVDFHELRAQEKIHRHPAREGKRQTEAYVVNKGSAVLLTIVNGKPHFNYMKSGDMAVISPDVAHCVLAASGDYEHMCFQVPSAFQYGFLFKDELNYEQFSTDHSTLLEAAKKGLAEGRHGTEDVRNLVIS